MASTLAGVWAIEIGNDALKAIRLSAASGTVEVVGFDHVPHGKILNGGGVSAAERDELIALGLRKFARENSLGKDDVVISVPSQNSFARFVNLPPVDEKKIPQVVRLEAGMQIPFDMSEVQWDWQLMGKGPGGEARVGIFAIKNEVVTKELEYYGGEDIAVSLVQMAPMALYNYLVYDRPDLVKSDTEGTVIINIGAENTDLVVCTKSTVWQRCVPMGGSAFTRAIAEAFKLNFQKAEKLKRTAAMSKYARQVFQAMRPVFGDFVSEIQRSLGFFSNSNPDTKLTKVIALGGGTKLRGLLKYLQQSLQMPVERSDSFKNLTISADVSAAKFHENANDFGVVYGLGLQGLGYSKIESNLLPRAVASSMAWASKAKYFTMAAAALLIVVGLCIGRTIMDRATYGTNERKRQAVADAIRMHEKAERDLNNEAGRGGDSEVLIDEAFKHFDRRETLPLVYETVLSVLPNAENNPVQKEFYDAYARGDVRAVKKVPRKQRKMVYLTSMMVYYDNDLVSAQLPATGMSRGRESGGRKRPGAMPGMMDPMGGMGMMPGMMGPMGGFGGFEGGYSDTFSRGSDEDEGEGGLPGFIVTIAGYTPYGNLEELLEPAGVGDDKSRWGIITRLMNLDSVAEDGNSPFQLYKKTDLMHFKPEKGVVAVEGDQPSGIGAVDEIDEPDSDEIRTVLRDPVTKEIISAEPVLDSQGRPVMERNKPKYRTNDHWFVLKFKLVWKEVAGDWEALEAEEDEDDY